MSDAFPAIRRTTIVNRKGLHARASAKVAKLAGEYDAQVFVSHESETADARSIMDLLMLVAHTGCVVEIKGRGAQADEAVEAIVRLIDDGFGETDS
ncbi:HPr family phosphocarrier protein [Hyphomonas sp.]|jgi:phosphocarrier protein|uniref:HPr family phosphocarrier protein n=1 Tax=Hyphomonas sp. TaxID=87 RepID=UPI0025BA9CCA|nr:HPr family phosphocarrier protein [Hyphomonas sp.]MBI1400507.1 HPr family phosphocarrier protein [Hyphomonas sp.]